VAARPARGRAQADQPLSQSERQQVDRLFSNPLLLPTIFKQWLVAYLGPEIQVTQSQVANTTTAVYIGSGTPEGSQSANVGSLYLRLDGAAGTTAYFKETGSGDTGWIARNVFAGGLTIADGQDISIGSATGTKIGAAGAKLGFYGATPVTKRSAYTQTYATADKTLSPASTSAFTGIDNAQVGSVYAKQADLEQLRQDMLDVAQFLNAVVDDLQSLGLTS
jgi:hypothetical protein